MTLAELQIEASKITSIDELMGKIATVESNGSYIAKGSTVTSGCYTGQYAVGRYQVMQGNIAPWTQEALGIPLIELQFVQSPDYQDATARYFMQKYYDQTKSYIDVASIWFSGHPYAGNTASDGNMAVPVYVANVITATPAPVTPSSVPSLLQSSADPTKLSATFIGLTHLAGTGMIYLGSQHIGLDVASTVSSLKDAFLAIVAGISGAIAFYGILRKVWYMFRS